MKTEHTTVFTCHQCKKEIAHVSSFSTGYGCDKDDNKICFECCGINDREKLKNMKIGEKTALYLDTKERVLTNWPGTLRINTYNIKTGSHNFAGKRYDTWFRFEGNDFHGVTYGDNSQICHIRRVKAI